MERRHLNSFSAVADAIRGLARKIDFHHTAFSIVVQSHFALAVDNAVHSMCFIVIVPKLMDICAGFFQIAVSVVKVLRFLPILAFDLLHPIAIVGESPGMRVGGRQVRSCGLRRFVNVPDSIALDRNAVPLRVGPVNEIAGDRGIRATAQIVPDRSIRALNFPSALPREQRAGELAGIA